MKNLKKNCKAKKILYSSLAIKKISNILKENDKILSQVMHKMQCFLLANVFEKFRNSSLKKYGSYLIHHLSPPALTYLSLNLFQMYTYIYSFKKV